MKDMEYRLKELKNVFTGSISDIYNNLNQYVVTPQQIVEKEKLEE